MSNGLWNQLAGKFKQFGGDIKQRWGKLTDDDLEKLQGQRDELVGIIQERYGIAQQEAEKQVDEWASGIKSRLNS